MVDFEKVIKGLEQCKEGGSCDGCPYDINSSRCLFLLRADALALLKEQPQIVRCKDCKYGWNINPSEEEKFYVCQNPTMVNMRYSHQGNWFCADGERAES